MSDEPEKIGLCGWLTFAIVLFLLPGILAGSFYGGFAGIGTLHFSLHGTAADVLSQILVLSGMIIGLLLATVSVMVLTLAVIRTGVPLLPRPNASLKESGEPQHVVRSPGRS